MLRGEGDNLRRLDGGLENRRGEARFALEGIERARVLRGDKEGVHKQNPIMICALDDDIARIHGGLRLVEILFDRPGVLGDVDIFDGNVVRVLARVFLGKLLDIQGFVKGFDNIPLGKELDGDLEALVVIAQPRAQRHVCLRADRVKLRLGQVHAEVEGGVQRGDDQVHADDERDEHDREHDRKRAVFEFLCCRIFHSLMPFSVFAKGTDASGGRLRTICASRRPGRSGTKTRPQS